MRQHFIYAMFSVDPAPAGDRDTGTWFFYYKWDNPDEVFVPWATCMPVVREGDILWFTMDCALLGGAVVERIGEDAINGKTELWFDTRKSFQLPRTMSNFPSLKASPLLDYDTGEAWFQASVPRLQEG